MTTTTWFLILEKFEMNEGERPRRRNHLFMDPNALLFLLFDITAIFALHSSFIPLLLSFDVDVLSHKITEFLGKSLNHANTTANDV
jgi:hypothetical protein